MSDLFAVTDWVVPFENLRMTDVDVVGVKNASLGEMIASLPGGVKVPAGFAITAHAFREFLALGDLVGKIKARLGALDIEDANALALAGAEIRAMVAQQAFPRDVEMAIRQAFAVVCGNLPQASFAVRSSAMAQNLPDAPFAGQPHTFLNVTGIEDLLRKIRVVFASLYSDRSISDRVHHGLAHEQVALSVGIQRMVRSDLGVAGNMFTLDTESGFDQVVFITSSYGLGEAVVQGAVNPDQFYLHKPMLMAGKQALIRRSLGSKLIQMQFSTLQEKAVTGKFGIPAVVGCGDADWALKDGLLVTVSCAEGDTGFVYDGLLETEAIPVKRGEMPALGVNIMMNVGNPHLAFDFCQLPNAGVGLARLEFIINHNIGVHPKAILDYPSVDADLKKAVESVACGHASPRAFYVDRVAEGVATIAAAFWPKPVIVRLSDFKSNEYRKLIGGSRYEPEEENPMLGFRGAARYLSADFGQAFAMECEALKRVRLEMGLVNVQVMVPFVRTLGQARKVTELLAEQGLKRGENALKLLMMCEIPSNAILAKEFLGYFDGFSIGSNDLTQLTLGLDRDSGLELLAKDFDERDPAVTTLISQAINACRAQGKYIGICGQGPSDHPDFAQWLMEEGISSISLNPETLVATWQDLAKP